jgi:hypothetical protein
LHGKDARELLARAVSRASGEVMSRLLALAPAANDEIGSSPKES